MLDHLRIKQADVLGYSMGGGVAMLVAIRHPEKVRKVVSISAVFRHDGWGKEAIDAFRQMTAGIGLMEKAMSSSDGRRCPRRQIAERMNEPNRREAHLRD